MCGFTLEFTFSDNAFVSIEGQNVRYWIGEGLPTFRGTLDHFAELFPERIKELMAHKVIKKLTK